LGGTVMDVEKLWGTKKSELLNNINKTIESGNVNNDVLEVMKELLEVTKVRVSINDYFKDQ
jgi:transcriptional regulator NrdR family protein